MVDAPRESLFVWCNNQLHYPRCLARTLERSDLRIISPGMLDLNTLHSARAGGRKLVFDHACDWSWSNDQLWRAYSWASQTGLLADGAYRSLGHAKRADKSSPRSEA